MNWRQRTVCRILLLLARIINEDDWLVEELKGLANHISAGEWAKT